MPHQLVQLLTGIGHDVDTVLADHYGLLLVRLPQPGRSALVERVSTLFRSEAVETWTGCVVSATPRKVWVKRAG